MSGRRRAAWCGLVVAGAVALAAQTSARAQTLRGSPAALDRQNDQAQTHGFTYLRTPEQVRQHVESGRLVRVHPTPDMDLHRVSFPYARPEVRLFLERLSAQYRSACGEKLVVTSLTRPISNQPRNASDRSVHPTGIAVDLRRSASSRCRSWLESTLLSLDAAGVLDATYERNPPHYHVAVFPRPYLAYLETRDAGAVAAFAAAATTTPAWSGGTIEHVVARGETLWGLASRYDVSVSRIRAENGIRGDRLMIGQRLRIPVYAVTAAAHGGGEVAVQAALHTPAPAPRIVRYTVQRGDTLWTIANRLGSTVDDIRRANGIASTRIYAGQILEIPLPR